MAKNAANSKLRKKIQYYLKASKEPVKVYAGWDARATNADGEHPAAYMKFNEFGTAHIPPRKLMKLTGDENRRKWQKALNLGLQDSTPMRQLGAQIGEMMAGDIRDKITSDLPPPNSPKTKRRKERQGKKAVTLRDSLFALQSVDFFVGKKPK